MAEPPATIPLTPNFLGRIGRWLEKQIVRICLLYRTADLIVTQLFISFTGAAFCGFETRNENESFKAAAMTTLLTGLLVAFVVVILSLFGERVRNWSRGHSADYWVFYYGLQAFGIGGLLRLCVFVSDVLGSQKNLDGYVTGFFMFSYLHVVCVTKLLKIKDVLCLSDSLMAMALLICARLDSKETIIRSVISYFSAFLLICFRCSTTPYEKNLPAATTTQPTIEEVEANILQTRDLERVLETGQEGSSSITELPTGMEEQALRQHWREANALTLYIHEVDSLLRDYQRLVTRKYEAQSSSTSADIDIISETYSFRLIKSASQDIIPYLQLWDICKLLGQYKTLVAANPTTLEDNNTGIVDQMGEEKSHRDSPEITELERVVKVPSESEDSEFVELASTLTHGDKQKGAQALRQRWKITRPLDLHIEELGSLLRDYQRLLIRKYEAQSSSTSADIGIIPETYTFGLIKSVSQLQLWDIFKLQVEYKALLSISAMEVIFPSNSEAIEIGSSQEDH